MFIQTMGIKTLNVSAATVSETTRAIISFSHSATMLKPRIDRLVAGGNTLIDLGTKWGAQL